MAVRPQIARRREQQVLVLCARPRVTDETQVRIRDLTRDPFDWQCLRGIAEEHGLWPLVFSHATAANAAMPPELAAYLSRRVVETTALNLSLTRQLAGLVDVLGAAGVPAVALKGPVLAAHAYGHLGLRPFGDLDVLVPATMAARAVSALLADGYREADQYAVTAGVYPAAGREFVLVPDDPSRVAVEVQINLSSWVLPVALSTEELIRRRRWLTLGGVRVPALSAEDQLLALAIHGTRHAWHSLRFVTDVHAATTAEPADWPVVFERARAARMARMLGVGLTLARDVLDTPLPPDIDEALSRDRGAASLSRRLAAQIFEGPPRFPHLRDTDVMLRSREHAGDRLRYLARTVAFERVIRPIDEWQSVGHGATAWRSAKIARRLALPLLVLAFYAASQTARPLAVGATLTTMIGAAYTGIHFWAARRVPVRSWARRNA